MDTLNMLRGILVGGAVLALLVAAAAQVWLTVGILGAGIAAHGAYWVVRSRERGRSAGPPAPQSPPARPDLW